MPPQKPFLHLKSISDLREDASNGTRTENRATDDMPDEVTIELSFKRLRDFLFIQHDFNKNKALKRYKH